MFSHITLGANDIEAARKFYDTTLGVLGAKPAITDAKGRLIYMHDGGLLLITPPIDGKPATCGNGLTVGFRMASEEQVNAWHDAGVGAGGTSIEDPPGVREAMGLYLAYLRDPSGNKLCGTHRLAQ